MSLRLYVNVYVKVSAFMVCWFFKFVKNKTKKQLTQNNKLVFYSYLLLCLQNRLRLSQGLCMKDLSPNSCDKQFAAILL